jgi:hypothetical protein
VGSSQRLRAVFDPPQSASMTSVPSLELFLGTPRRAAAGTSCSPRREGNSASFAAAGPPSETEVLLGNGSCMKPTADNSSMLIVRTWREIEVRRKEERVWEKWGEGRSWAGSQLQIDRQVVEGEGQMNGRKLLKGRWG